MKKSFITILILFVSIGLFGKVYNIEELDADTKGNQLCTSIINKAIQQAADEGGGTIYFPSGTYKTGAIQLESNITIHLEPGAILSFSDDFNEYLPFIKVRHEGVFMNSFKPLIHASNCENISITGQGKLIGNGSKWWEEYYKLRSISRDTTKNTPLNELQELWEKINKEFMSDEIYNQVAKHRFFRPSFIQFLECKNITLDGFTINDSPFWTINPVGCEDVTIHNLKVFNPDEGPNTDGINPSSCKNVRISDCYISVGDDCITIKSGKNKDGRDYAQPCENITITNCIMEAGHGGVVVGSEMSGGVKNVVISNCIFDATDNGIRFKSARGRGGVVESISVNNIVMRNIQRDAFIFNLFYDKKSVVEEVSERTPVFRNIHISNITGTDIKSAGFILGIEEMPVSDLTFTNITLQSQSGLSVKNAKDIKFENIDFSIPDGHALDIKESSDISLNDIKSSQDNTQSLIKITDCDSIFISNSYPINCDKKLIESINSKIVTDNICINAFEGVVDLQ